VAALAAYGQPAPSFTELVRGSGLIFQGTIKAIGKATPSVPVQPNTAVVTVDRVIEEFPPALNQKGREVTVRLRDAGRMKPGQAATFFTHVYSAGPSLGLEEVGTMPIQDPAALEKRVAGARQTLADEALSQRLASARFVVAGELVRPEGADTAAREPVSEHDPLWRAMEVRADSFEKGARPNQALMVNVATSTDVMWARAPKPTPNTKWILLLQPQPGPDHWSGVTGLFLVGPLDALPLNELDRVRRLVKALR
jgi:hypothetical protein